ncbi:hypothetical protein BS50DRAFT_44430 [Corynespora cassiicola Philippines]|uniref:Mid2 domain-containing protein n=1 Tax=Corynespora cassiicola Philippines TaxID=1448308 RepID=A0A2T2PDF1_CORCC|nr:hypothetical protein BS50DRAFT_44430 [Corynespora cassiicola Philippines]
MEIQGPSPTRYLLTDTPSAIPLQTGASAQQHHQNHAEFHVQGDKCLANGICQTLDLTSVPNEFRREWCTDKTFADPSCPNLCNLVDSDGALDNLFLYRCPSTGKWCCSSGDGQDDNDCCADKTAANVVDARQLKTIYPEDIPRPTNVIEVDGMPSPDATVNINTMPIIVATTVSPWDVDDFASNIPEVTYPSPRSSAEAAAEAARNPLALGLGLGLGIPLGLLIIAVLIYLSLRYRRKQMKALAEKKRVASESRQQMNQDYPRISHFPPPPRTATPATRSSSRMALATEKYPESPVLGWFLDKGYY